MIQKLLSFIGLQKRSGVSNPAQWLLDWAGGSKTSSGVTVNEGTALKYTPVWAAINIIAGAVGYLPLLVYKRTGDGKERATGHPAYKGIHDQPNPYMSAQTFRETLTAHTLSWGNGYAEIERDNGGRVVNQWPLLPNCMKIEVNTDTGEPTYVYRLPDGQSTRLPSRNVLHIHGLGFNGYQGYSPIRMHMNSIGLGMAAEAYGGTFFGNASRPSGVLEHPNKLSDDGLDHLRKTWEATNGGISNMHRVAILEEGMKWTQMGIPPEEAQFLETRNFQVSDVSRIYNVPLHMLGNLENATFSNIEHQGIQFVTYTLNQWTKRWESETNAKIIGNAAGDTFFSEFIVDALQRGDTASRYAAYAIGRQWGWLSANDIRDYENMNRIEGGDMYLVPMNMTPADMVGVEPVVEPAPDPPADEDPPEDPDDDERTLGAHLALIRETVERFQHKESERIKRAAGRGTLGPHAKDFYEQFPADIYDRLGPVVRSFAEALGKDPNSVYLTDYLTDFAQHYARDAREALSKAPTPQDYIESLDADEVARRIAREVQNV